MSDAGWRSRIRWVVVHPHRPQLLLVERAGVLALPETEHEANSTGPTPVSPTRSST